MSTIRTDVANDEGALEAADAFSKLWSLDAPNELSEPDDELKKKQDDEPAEDEPTDDEPNGDDEASEETPEDNEGAEGDEDGDEDQEEEGDKPTITISDDHKIKVPVDGEEREFTIGSLKRLAGQEAALTRKGQEVATKRKQVDEQGAVVLAQAKALLDRAKAKYEPFSKLDFLALSKDPNISAEELVAARNLAKQAYEDVQFLEQNAAQVAESLRNQARQDLMEQAQESIKLLSDPEKGIEGFNQQLYGEICQFAVESGLPQEIVNDLVNPAAIKLINMARLYAKGQKNVQKVVKEADKKKKAAPKRIVKGTSSAEQTKQTTKTAKNAEPMKRLRSSGSVDDAADAFMARWSQSDED